MRVVRIRLAWTKTCVLNAQGISKGVRLNVIHINSILKIFLSLTTSFVTQNHNKVQQKKFFSFNHVLYFNHV